MKSKLRRPFRAPREAVDRSKGEKLADQSDIAREEPPNNVVQTESEEATELGVVWKPFVVKETEYPEVEPVDRNVFSSLVFSSHCLFYSCLVLCLSCLQLLSSVVFVLSSCLVLSCLGLFCLGLSFGFLALLVLSWLVLSWLVLSRFVLSCLCLVSTSFVLVLPSLVFIPSRLLSRLLSCCYSLLTVILITR